MNNYYDHYIGLDWAQLNMAYARLTPKSNRPHAFDQPSSIRDLKDYLKALKGSKILTFEETTTAQWLYTELRECVDKIVVCNPKFNRSMHYGPKTDKIDAINLARLLRLDNLKSVFHTGDQFIYLRKLTSGYEDIVKSYVKCVNQKHSIYRALGKRINVDLIEGANEEFVILGLDKQISLLSEQRERYESEFSRLCKKYRLLRNLDSIPGIGPISAVKIAARIVDIDRFPSVRHFWSYLGLIKYEKLSGGRSYGKRRPEYCREMKSTFCSAVISATNKGTDTVLGQRFKFLKEHKGYSDYQAKTAVRRLLASIVYGVMKSGERFNPARIKTMN